MKIPAGWTQTYEFACHSASCAPPPVGSGGSSGGGKRNPAKDVYNSMTWKQSAGVHRSGDYEIRAEKSGLRGFGGHIVSYKGERIGKEGNLKEAKVRAEFHSDGIPEQAIKFWNVPSSAPRKRSR